MATFNGTANADTLTGSASSDVITGGQGDDSLVGNDGIDTYTFNLGDGEDTIDDNSAPNIIRFGSGITKNNVKLVKNDNDLEIYYSFTDKITVHNYFNNTNSINYIAFADNSTIKKEAIPNFALSFFDLDHYYNTAEIPDRVYSCGDYTLPDNIANLTLYGGKGLRTKTPSGTSVLVYGNPFEWGKYLDYYQGDNSSGFQQDCGVVACENALIQSGILDLKTSYRPGYDSLESEVIYRAIQLGAYSEGETVADNGATYYSDRRDILQDYNPDYDLSFQIFYDDFKLIGEMVESSYCIIAGVSSQALWYGGAPTLPDHAVVITGVAYNSSNQIEGFYICDSGRGLKSDASRFISYALAAQSICSYEVLANKTDFYPTKINIDPLIGIGNATANNIEGNAGNNKIYGLDGADTLDGSTGKDTLVGGKGDDVYYLRDNDVIIENNDEGSDSVLTNFDYTIPENCSIERLQLLEGSTSGVGNSLDNTIIGNTSANTLVGNAGYDIFLEGNTGNDTLNGGSGDDSYGFIVGDGIDTIIEENVSWKQGWCFRVPQEDEIYFADSEVNGNTVSITKNDIILTKNNNNLEIHYSASDKIIVQNQLTNTLTRVEKVSLSDGNYLTDSIISTVIQQMTTFATANNIDISSYTAVKNSTELITILNSAWISA